MIDLLERLAQALDIGVADLLPLPSSADSPEDHRARVLELFGAVVKKAGPETLSMIEVLLSRLGETRAVSR